jgi:hypothetical protein
MNYKFLNIKDFKIMYITTYIGVISCKVTEKFGLLDILTKSISYNIKEISLSTLYIHSFIISKFGGAAHFKYDKTIHHYFLKLNEILYDNFNDLDKVQNEYNKLIKNYEKSKFIIDIFNVNSIKMLINKGNKNEYYSLLFLAVPFALKLKDKNKLINELKTFIEKYTDDINHILSTITAALYIHYALNNISMAYWIENITEDLKDIKNSDKYLDYINKYNENNYRNHKFQQKDIDYIVSERNKYFMENYCSSTNRVLTEKPEENIMLIFDILLRSGENWEKLILFGLTNFNDNISIGVIVGILYEILFSTKQVNKNLIKRFSF